MGGMIKENMAKRAEQEIQSGMIKKYHPVWLNTHFNTSLEITEESKLACEKLVNAGVPVGNQAVILAGINDSVRIMKKLMHDLVKMRVRPYYIYQIDAQ